MPIYTWKGINSYGEKRKGEIEAVDEAGAQAQLKRMRIDNAVIKLKPKDLFEGVSLFQPKVTGKDIVVFTRQMATMIDAGLPLVQCLQILSKQQENATFKRTLLTIQSDVESGTTLADSMRKHPKVFDDLFTNMIEAGEMGGILDTILGRLASFREKSMNLKKRIKGAMSYPVICLGIAGLILIVILVFVIPVFVDMFSTLGSDLPAITKMVVDASDFAKANVVWILLGLGGVFFLLKKYYGTRAGRFQIDGLLLNSPIIGPLTRRVAVSNFTRTLSTMLQSGVPILDSLDVVARTSGNAIIERAVMRVADGISEGRPIAEPLDETGVFPNMVVQMINVGESVGALDVMLEKIAEFYDDEVNQAVDNLTSMIEPLMMVFLGVVIGGVVIAMYLPIFQMAGAV